MAFYNWKQQQLQLLCQLQANAKHNEFCEIMNDRLKIRIKAPALEGKANKALTEFLAKEFKVAKSAVKITQGETARLKTVMIDQPQLIPTNLDIQKPLLHA